MSKILTYDSAWKAVGGLGSPSKMPCYSWSISALRCKMGSKIGKIANSVCRTCYALRGNYRYEVVANAHENRWKALKKKGFVEAFTFLVKCLSQKYIRLYDSGDLDSLQTLQKWIDIAHNCPETKFWLPTKEYKIVSDYIKLKGMSAIPNNLNIRLSGYMMEGDGPVALAKSLGVTISEVKKENFTCPASKQGNKCETCRACWDKNVFNVVYKRH